MHTLGCDFFKRDLALKSETIEYFPGVCEPCLKLLFRKACFGAQLSFLFWVGIWVLNIDSKPAFKGFDHFSWKIWIPYVRMWPSRRMWFTLWWLIVIKLTLLIINFVIWWLYTQTWIWIILWLRFREHYLWTSSLLLLSIDLFHKLYNYCN